MEYTFQSLTSHPSFPRRMKRKLEQLKFLRERPDYHPEKSANEHIKIVTTRLTETGDIDLICTGIFHDIGKFSCVEENPKTGYPTSPGHDKYAYNLIMNSEECKNYIASLGGNYEKVALLCKEHMRIKQFDKMKRSKREDFKKMEIFKELLIFTEADNMLKEFDFKEVLREIKILHDI